MKFTMPEALPTDRAELAALSSQAEAEIAVFQARHNAGDEFTSEEVDRFEHLVDAGEQISEAVADLDASEAESSSRVTSLMERSTPKPAAPAAPVEEVEPVDETPEVEVDAPADTPVEVPVEAEAPVSVAASVNFAASTTSTVPDADGDPGKPWALLPSAPNYAKHSGKGASLRDIAMGIASVDAGSGQGIRQTGSAGTMAKQAIASITRPQVTMEATSEQAIYDFLQNLGKEIPGHGDATAEGLVAAGGWCAPSQQLYTFCDVPPASGLISLPDFPFDMSRGGVRVPVNPDISALLTDLWQYTETELEAVEESGDPTVVKPIIELPCPDTFLEWRLEAIGWAAKAGILQRKAWPEAIENALQQIQVAHQHRVSQASITKMVAGSGSAKVVPSDAVLGATSSVLNGLARNAVNLRLDKGLGANATIEGVTTIWFREVLRADLALREGKELLSVSDSEIDSWLAVRNVYLQYVNDWQPLNTATQTWPGSVDVLLYPAGTWFRQLANVITLGVQYPLEQLQLNQYTHIFTEDSFQVGKRCNDSQLIRIPLCVNGAVGAREQIDCTVPYATTTSVSITTTGIPDGGTFTLEFSGGDAAGVETGTIAFGASAANVKTAIVALDDGYAAADITTSGGALPTAVVVTYPAALGTLSVGTNGLTGGTSPAVVIA